MVLNQVWHQPQLSPTTTTTPGTNFHRIITPCSHVRRRSEPHSGMPVLDTTVELHTTEHTTSISSIPGCGSDRWSSWESWVVYSVNGQESWKPNFYRQAIVSSSQTLRTLEMKWYSKSHMPFLPIRFEPGGSVSTSARWKRPTRTYFSRQLLY